eukprot:8587878-Ditylum_brightwellii.AAC.1
MTTAQKQAGTRFARRALLHVILQDARRGSARAPPLGWRCDELHGKDALFASKGTSSDGRPKYRSSRE